MTYIYRFTIKETHECYVGQHRTTSYNDPYKDCYRGSGTEWKQLLINYDLWELKKFRKGVKKEILKVWKNNVSRKEVGKAEKEAIEQTRKIYSGLFDDLCVNISNGSLPSWIYDTQEEAEQVKKRKEYYKKHKEYIIKRNLEYAKNHKEQTKESSKKYYKKHKNQIVKRNQKYAKNHKEQTKESNKKYYYSNKEYIIKRNSEYQKQHKEQCKINCLKYNEKHRLENKVHTFIYKHNYPSPDTAIFPKSWTDKEITEYKRQWEKHNEL